MSTPITWERFIPIFDVHMFFSNGVGGRKHQLDEYTPPKTNMDPQKWSFPKGVFSGSMLVFGGVVLVSNILTYTPVI